MQRELPAGGKHVGRIATRKDSAALRKQAPPAGTAKLNGREGGTAHANGVHAGRNGNGAPNGHHQGDSLESYVFRSLEQYFASLDGAKPHALHEMVLGAIEKPLLQFALQRCDGNQSAAADLLGMNRNTLRRKLQDYGLH
jgi:Fis family transcriptional regulator, factor for inversion stimulation protein